MKCVKDRDISETHKDAKRRPFTLEAAELATTCAPSRTSPRAVRALALLGLLLPADRRGKSPGRTKNAHLSGWREIQPSPPQRVAAGGFPVAGARIMTAPDMPDEFPTFEVV